jgi:hypothetical protein
MNYRGSYRKLLANSVSAMVGAMEIYNKPRFDYRDEVFVILLINAWELLLKAIVSKDGQRIFYAKRRGEPYKTISCRDAFWRAANSKLWPAEIESKAVDANIELLSTYRDSAVHFYNDKSFAAVIYALAQTSILNYRDLARKVFQKDISDEITWRILPIGIENPIDPIAFMKSYSGDRTPTRAIQDFLAYLKEKTDALEADRIDTSRLLTVFDVSLQSIKKIDKADIVVGVTSDELKDAIIVNRRMDPNLTHPYRQKEVLLRLKRKITGHAFQAIVYAYNMRADSKYFWKDEFGSIAKWSGEAIRFIDSFAESEVIEALEAYKRRPPGAACWSVHREPL